MVDDLFRGCKTDSRVSVRWLMTADRDNSVSHWALAREPHGFGIDELQPNQDVHGFDAFGNTPPHRDLQADSHLGLNGRREAAALIFCGMASKRQGFDPLKPSNKARWLSRLDEHNRIQEVQELKPGADLRSALAQQLEQLRSDGWLIEGVSFSGSFIRRGATRHYVSVYPKDPRDQPISLHGPYPGAHR